MGRVPAAAEVARFWELVEAAWAACGPEAAGVRRALVQRAPAEDDDGGALEAFMDEFLTHWGGCVRGCPVRS